MKRTLLFLTLIGALSWASCDKVNPPNYGCMDPLALNYDSEATLDDGHCVYPPGVALGCIDTLASNYDPAAMVDDCHCRYENMRTVLVEDYTGFRCPNCPRAAEALHELQCLYGARIVPIAVHVGESFASPENNPDGSFSTDFRTPIGDAYDLQFSNSLFLPNGLINRKSFDGLHPQLHGQWPDLVAAILSQPADVWLDIEVTYDSISRNATASIDLDVFNALNDGPYRLAVLLTEDSVIDWQLDNAATPPVIEDYVHMHVLRDGFTEAWGQAVNGGAAMAAGHTENASVNLTINTEFEDKNCNVVAFVFRDDTKEVIQSQFVPLIEQ